MIVDDTACICAGCPKDNTTCLKNDHCNTQRHVVMIQNIIRALDPQDVIVLMGISKCPYKVVNG